MGIIINGQNDTIGPVDNSMSLLGTVSIGGTMTIEDFTNIDSVGLITARNGLHVTSGNVAIGHNNPLNTLHVKGPTGGVSARFTDAVNATVFVSHPSSGKSKIADAGGNYGFEFDTASVNILSGGSERLRITSTGNVGINDTNPTAKLSVIGNLYVSADSFTGENSGIFFSGWNDYGAGVYGRNSGNDLVMNAGSGEKVRVTSAGNVGIGTDNPGHLLDLYNSAGSDCLRLNVNGGAGGSNKQNAIRFSVDGDVKAHMGLAVDAGRLISGSIANDFCLKGLGSNNILFATNSSERLRINSGGNVQVNGGAVHIDANGELAVFETDTNLAFTNSSKLAFDFSSNVARIRTSFNGSGSIRPLAFYTGNTERLRITSDGKVGINKTVPGQRLHVSGSIAMDQTNGLLFFAKDGEGVNTNTNNTHWIGRVDNAGYHATSGAGGFNSVAGSFAIGAKGPIMFATSGNTDNYSSGRMIITADGKLGLGVASPTQMMDISNASGTGAQIQFRDNGTGVGTNDGLRVGYNGSGGQMWNFEPTYIRFATSNTERLRITSAGSLLHKGNNSNTIDNTDGDGQTSNGYPAGGATFNKNVSVNNNAGGFGQCMNMISHTKVITLNGSTNHDMVTIWNREGCFIGHVYAGYSTGGDGAVAMYKFNTFYSANSIIAELGPSSRSSDSISVNITSSGDSHTFRVNGNGYGPGDVTIGLVFLSAGVAGTSAHYGVRYY